MIHPVQSCEVLGALAAGTRIGAYEIVAPLGAGGMGERAAVSGTGRKGDRVERWRPHVGMVPRAS